MLNKKSTKKGTAWGVLCNFCEHFSLPSWKKKRDVSSILLIMLPVVEEMRGEETEVELRGEGLGVVFFPDFWFWDANRRISKQKYLSIVPLTGEFPIFYKNIHKKYPQMKSPVEGLISAIGDPLQIQTAFEASPAQEYSDLWLAETGELQCSCLQSTLPRLHWSTRCEDGTSSFLLHCFVNLNYSCSPSKKEADHGDFANQGFV